MRIIVRAAAGALALVGLGTAQAQENSDGVIDPGAVVETVRVTARLRAEDSLDVPFALTTLDATMLDRRRIDDSFSFFRHAPGLSLTSFDDGRFAYYQLRGIGPLSQAIGPDDGSVVTYVDGVPQPVFASEFAYLDLERMEVLRGPQGTLFGRNSQGGAIHITTRAPTDAFVARARIEGGEQGFGLAQATLSGPLGGDRARGRLSLRASTLDGFVDNTAPVGGSLGGRTEYAGRGVLVIDPATENGFRATVAVNADSRESNPYFYVLREQSPARVEVDPRNRTDRTAWGASMKLEKPLGFGDFTSITAVNGFHTDQFLDDTNGLIYGPLFGLPPSAFLPPLDFSDWEEEERRFYQELRLAGTRDDGLAWSAGVVYFRSELDVELDNRSTFSPVLNGDRDAEQLIDSYAAYGEVTAPIGPRLTATVGARYTRDEKSLEATFSGVGFPGSVDSFAEDSEANFDLLTGRAAITFAAADDVNLYATVARGAKSGGFPRLTLNAAFGVDSPAYAESTSWTYEAGVKSRLLDGRATFNVAGFYNDVTDEQLLVLDLVAFQFVPVNLDTRAFGLEAEGALAIDRHWSIAGGLAWTDSEMRDADSFSGAEPGNPVPNVPELSTTLTLNYRGDVTGAGSAAFEPFLTLTHQYMGARAVDVADSFELDAYHNVDLRVGAAFGDVEVFAFGRNLLDEEQEINGVLFGPGVGAVSLGQPRVLGIGISATLP
ncbi:MAG: TonB-dependent receptor [Pseudomonadota bacterium]